MHRTMPFSLLSRGCGHPTHMAGEEQTCFSCSSTHPAAVQHVPGSNAASRSAWEGTYVYTVCSEQASAVAGTYDMLVRQTAQHAACTSSSAYTSSDVRLVALHSC
jgi:hypothetical protein